jgi:membrane protein YqaA with SNARE-associated domain
MLEGIVLWLRHLHLVHNYGFAGLFFASLIGSTIFLPFSTEAAMLVLVASGANRLGVLLVATLGSVGGTLVNYYIGYAGIRFVDRCLKKEDTEKAHRMMNKYGWAGLFIVLATPIPFPVDPLTILCGAMRMDLKRFVAVVFLGKLIKYALVLGLLSLIF